MAKCSSSAILPCMVSPRLFRGRRRTSINLNTARVARLPPGEARSNSAGTVLAKECGVISRAVPFRSSAEMCSPKSDNRAPASMNLNPSYTLASSPQTGRSCAAGHRCRAATFSTAIFLIERRLDRRDVVHHRHRVLLHRLRRHRRHGSPASRSAWWRRAFSPFRTFSAANTGCRTSSPSSRMRGGPYNCGT